MSTRLLEVPSKHYGKKDSDNILIHGESLEALKILERTHKEKIKCIYIDPPYNTGNKFTHYNDNLNHEDWINFMRERLIILRDLLSEDGSIWVSIDDNNQAYLKILMDEVFNRKNFVCNVVWIKRFSPANNCKLISVTHDFIIVFAKNIKKLVVNRLDRSLSKDNSKNRYRNLDNDPRGLWRDAPLDSPSKNENNQYEIINPNGDKVLPPAGRGWSYSKEKFKELLKDNRIYWSKNDLPSLKKFLSEMKGLVPSSMFSGWEVGFTDTAKKEILKLNNQDIFDTPKPERLIERILTIATNENDLVLDCFLGSGTTAAVATKLNRKWIGIELGEHINTLVLPRLKLVVDGVDDIGISKAVNWQGGGGFKFYELIEKENELEQLDLWEGLA